MSISLQLDPDSGVIVATCSGDLGIDDGKAAAADLWGKPEWSGRPVIWDFRQARLNVHAPQVRQFAQFVLQHQPMTPPYKVAMVTGRDVDFGLARMFEVFREHPSTEVRTFRDFSEAMSWARSPRKSHA